MKPVCATAGVEMTESNFIARASTEVRHSSTALLVRAPPSDAESRIRLLRLQPPKPEGQAQQADAWLTGYVGVLDDAIGLLKLDKPIFEIIRTLRTYPRAFRLKSETGRLAWVSGQQAALSQITKILLGADRK